MQNAWLSRLSDDYVSLKVWKVYPLDCTPSSELQKTVQPCPFQGNLTCEQGEVEIKLPIL